MRGKLLVIETSLELLDEFGGTRYLDPLRAHELSTYAKTADLMSDDSRLTDATNDLRPFYSGEPGSQVHQYDYVLTRPN